MKRPVFWFALLLSLGLAYVSAVGCGKKSDDKNDEEAGSGDDGSDDPSGPGSLAFGEKVNLTIPRHLAVTSPTIRASKKQLQAGNIAVGSEFSLQEGEGDDYLSLVERIGSVLDATELSGCLGAVPEEFNLAQGNFGHASCFGPSVSYTNHPDGIADGSIGNGDLGIWFEYAEVDETSGEACGSRVVNNLMHNVGSYANTAVGMQAMVACAMRLTETALPTDATPVDAMAAIAQIDTSERSFSLTSATMAVISAEGAAYPTYETTIAGSLEDVPRDMEKDFELVVRHIPTGEKHASYKGRIQFIIKDFESGRDLPISLAYEWGESKLNYRYRQQQTEDATFDSFDEETSELIVEDNAGLSEVVVAMDENGFGKVAFGWGTFDLLVFNAETKSDGTGVAYFGHNELSSVEAGTSGFHKIKGLRCLPVNPPPNNTEPYTSFVQRQVLAVDTSSGYWEPSSSDITFAPTSNCEWNDDNDNSSTFTVEKETQDGKENVSLSKPIEADLFDLADYKDDWTAPEAPAAL